MGSVGGKRGILLFVTHLSPPKRGGKRAINKGIFWLDQGTGTGDFGKKILSNNHKDSKLYSLSTN